MVEALLKFFLFISIFSSNKIALSNLSFSTDIKKLDPSGIILSPGPKHPADSNICLDILKSIPDIPVLGICLGHQAVGYSCSGLINRLSTPVHGKVSNVNIIKKEKLFQNIPEKFSVMRYHSLYISENNFNYCRYNCNLLKFNFIMGNFL